MKITISKLLDASQIDAEILPKIQPLITQLNQSTEQFTRALRNELTLTDNVKAIVKSFSSIPHNTLTQLSVGSNNDVEGIFIGASSKMVTGFYWELGSIKGSINVRVKTENSDPTDLKLIIFFK